MFAIKSRGLVVLGVDNQRKRGGSSLGAALQCIHDQYRSNSLSLTPGIDRQPADQYGGQNWIAR